MELPCRRGDADLASGLQLAAQVDEVPGDLWSFAQLRLDPRQHAAVLPERALLTRAAVGVPVRDQLDRAERHVVLVGHGPSIGKEGGRHIGLHADAVAGSRERYAARGMGSGRYPSVLELVGNTPIVR